MICRAILASNWCLYNLLTDQVNVAEVLKKTNQVMNCFFIGCSDLLIVVQNTANGILMYDKMISQNFTIDLLSNCSFHAMEAVIAFGCWMHMVCNGIQFYYRLEPLVELNDVFHPHIVFILFVLGLKWLILILVWSSSSTSYVWCMCLVLGL